MKILQLLSCKRLGGTETFAIDIVKGLRKRRIDCFLANVWMPSEMDEVASKELQEAYWGIKGSYSIGFQSIYGLIKLFRKEKFDIIHSYGLRISLVARLLKHFSSCKVFCMGIRGLDAQRSKVQSWLDRITEPLVDKVVCNAQAVANVRIEREKTNKRKIEIIPNGINTEVYDPEKYKYVTREMLGIKHTGLLFVCVGNFRPEKDHRNLIDAVALIRHSIKNTKFLFVGQDLMQADIENYIANQNLNSYFEFYGASKEIPKMLSVCDGFVLPSKSEGMPRAMMEAMSMALPVIATDAGGVPEVIEDNVSGLIVPKGNPVALSEALQELIVRPDIRMSLGVEARQRIINHFSLDIMIDKYQQFYNSLLKNAQEV